MNNELWKNEICDADLGWFAILIWFIESFSNKSPTRCNNFPVYYPDVYIHLNMFRALHLVGDLFEMYDDSRTYKP